MEEGERRRRRVRGPRGGGPVPSVPDGATDPVRAGTSAAGTIPTGTSAAVTAPAVTAPAVTNATVTDAAVTVGVPARPGHRPDRRELPGAPHGPDAVRIRTRAGRAGDDAAHPDRHRGPLDDSVHTPDDREGERGLRGLIGGGSSQVSVTAALRARDSSRPTDADIAHAEANLAIVHRGWVPRDA